MSTPGATRRSATGASWVGAGKGVADAGFTVSVVVRTTPASVAVIVTLVALVTAAVIAVKPTLEVPAANVTLGGTVTTPGRLLANVATGPPAAAALVNVSVPADDAPPVTLAGFKLTADSEAGGGTGVSASVAVRVTPANDAESTALLAVATAVVATEKVAEVAPAAIVTLAGTTASAVFALDSATTAPPAGAAPVSETLPWVETPPTTLAGETASVLSDATTGAALGVKRSMAENDPNAPAEFCARTRQNKRCAGRPVTVACETFTIGFAANGAVTAEDVLTWSS